MGRGPCAAWWRGPAPAEGPSAIESSLNGPPPHELRSQGGLPKLERLPLHLADQFRRLRSLPKALVAVSLRAGDPPALAWQSIGLPHDEHRELGLAPRLAFLVDIGQHLAQLPHLRA